MAARTAAGSGETHFHIYRIWPSWREMKTRLDTGLEWGCVFNFETAKARLRTYLGKSPSFPDIFFLILLVA